MKVLFAIRFLITKIGSTGGVKTSNDGKPVYSNSV